MDSLLSNLQTQTNVRSMSVGDLTPNKKYCVERFSARTTQYGPAVLCLLKDRTDDGMIEVFLPKSISLSENEIEGYNNRVEKNLKLIYTGKVGKAFKITFE